MQHVTHRQRVDAHLKAYLAQPATSRSPEAFAAFAAARGAPVRIVDAGGGAGPDRTWVRILNVDGIHGYDVDVAEPEPLVWPMDGAHPVAGGFTTMNVRAPGRR
ncbi:hypothetical protein DSM112329_04178 [Paraconexibacter sp. AEG42_29]|uniref:Uncharacterized protein n=1 Tax=Paraconexibacter sp. AEG42_29 TaxID=2997339 RepID=A0AAU7B0Y8_9ACTN